LKECAPFTGRVTPDLTKLTVAEVPGHTLPTLTNIPTEDFSIPTVLGLPHPSTTINPGSVNDSWGARPFTSTSIPFFSSGHDSNPPAPQAERRYRVTPFSSPRLSSPCAHIFINSKRTRPLAHRLHEPASPQPERLPPACHLDRRRTPAALQASPIHPPLPTFNPAPAPPLPNFPLSLLTDQTPSPQDIQISALPSSLERQQLLPPSARRMLSFLFLCRLSLPSVQILLYRYLCASLCIVPEVLYENYAGSGEEKTWCRARRGKGEGGGR